MGALADAFQMRSGSSLPAKVDAIAQTATDAKANVLMGRRSNSARSSQADGAQDVLRLLPADSPQQDHGPGFAPGTVEHGSPSSQTRKTSMRETSVPCAFDAQRMKSKIANVATRRRRSSVRSLIGVPKRSQRSILSCDQAEIDFGRRAHDRPPIG